MSDQPTLRTLLEALYQAGMQAVALSLTHTGRTADVVEEIQRELQRCAEVLDSEIKGGWTCERAPDQVAHSLVGG